MVQRMNYSWLIIAAIIMALTIVFSLLVKDVKKYVQKVNQVQASKYIQIE